MPMPSFSSRVVEAALTYRGVPFRHLGRDRQGVDCIGLLLAAARDCGFSEYDDVPYGRVVDPARLRRELGRFCDERPAETDLQIGDVLLFRMAGNPQHVGIVVSIAPDVRFLHAHEAQGKVIESRLFGGIEESLEAVYRWRP